MKSVLETINAGSEYLKKRGIEDSRRNMEHLLARELGCGRMQLYTQFDRPLQEEELAPLREALRKRGEGVPLQHILGVVCFYGRDFVCDGRALIPRPETEELVEIVLKVAPQKPMDVLDMGCGSGVIGLTLAAERPECRVKLVDVSPEALSLSRENAQKTGVGNVDFSQSDLFSDVSAEFDLIVANLPYVASGEVTTMAKELSYDPSLALFSGEDGLDLLRKFIPAAYAHMKPGGLLALEIGYDQESAVEAMMREAGFREIEVRKDISGVARFPIALR